MTQSLNLAVIPGDGIGPEVTKEALETLKAVSTGVLDVRETTYTLGAAHFLETGEILSDETLQKLAGHDAILLGAVGGDPRDPVGGIDRHFGRNLFRSSHTKRTAIAHIGALCPLSDHDEINCPRV